MSTALAVVPDGGFTQDQIDLIKSQVAPPGTTNDELALFLAYAQRTGLDPVSRQVYLSERRSNVNGQWVTTRKPEVTIDGFRLIAERTGHYAGQVGPYWCGKDGQWVDVWLEDAPPSAARVGVLRDDFKEPLYGVALWKEYVQTKNDGSMTSMWKTKGVLMLAKCAESIALRRAFPRELSGIYSQEEMSQAGNEERGSVQAANNVAADKLEQLGASPEVVEAARQPKQRKPSTSKPTADQLAFLKPFGEIKAELHKYDPTDAVYYAALQGDGFEHANDIKDKEHARAVYKKMAGALSGLKQAAADRSEAADLRKQLGEADYFGTLEGFEECECPQCHGSGVDGKPSQDIAGIATDPPCASCGGAGLALDNVSGEALGRVLMALRTALANKPKGTSPELVRELASEMETPLPEPEWKRLLVRLEVKMIEKRAKGRWLDILERHAGARDIKAVGSQETADKIAYDVEDFLNPPKG